MHWYTLVPFDALVFQNIKPTTPRGQTWESGDRFPPSGRTLVAALQDLLQESAIITLSGPFLCHADTLYFPRPFHYSGVERLIPATWLPEQTDSDEGHFNQRTIWDRRKPAPLLGQPLDAPNRQPLQQERQFLPYESVLKLLKTHPLAQADWQCAPGERPQPWTVETRSPSTLIEETYLLRKSAFAKQTIRLEPGWKLAIALDQATHEKLKQLGEVFLVRLGEEGHQFWLESYHEPLNQQWQTLQEQSQKNRQTAEQARAEASQQARILAYLVTPGVFERKHMDVATCRASPWEWDLAYSINQNQHQGPLVSVATANPLPINCRSLSKSTLAKQGSSSQVFAVAPGSVYYLEYPAELFQDRPFLRDGRMNKVHIWRQLGYSELLWIPYT
ncbi:MAG TPA: type III-B CRISPR module-associated Cmr3 family protein [Coleofasciculaceae cyanobacterium]